MYLWKSLKVTYAPTLSKHALGVILSKKYIHYGQKAPMFKIQGVEIAQKFSVSHQNFCLLHKYMLDNDNLCYMSLKKD